MSFLKWWIKSSRTWDEEYGVWPNFEICCRELGGLKVTTFRACVRSVCSVAFGLIPFVSDCLRCKNFEVCRLVTRLELPILLWSVQQSPIAKVALSGKYLYIRCYYAFLWMPLCIACHSYAEFQRDCKLLHSFKVAKEFLLTRCREATFWYKITCKGNEVCFQAAS